MARISWITISAILQQCCFARHFNPMMLLPRQQSITLCGGDASLQPCDMPFPLSFCCPLNTVCKLTNGTSTVTAVCCPDGFTCGKIDTITCNVSLQNANLFPGNSIHTLNLTEALPVCEDGQCCPFGYECAGNGTCNALKDAVSSSSSSSASSSPSLFTSEALTTMTMPLTMTVPTTTMSSIIVSSPTSHPGTSSTVVSASTSSASTIPKKSSSLNGGLLVAGLVPGIAVAVTIIGVIMFCVRRKRRQIREITPVKRVAEKPGSPPGSSSSKSRLQISSPIAPPEFAADAGAEMDESSDGVTRLPPPPPLPLNTSRTRPISLLSPLSPPSSLRSDSDLRASQGTIRVGLSREPWSPLLPATVYNPNAAQAAALASQSGPLSRYNINASARRPS